MDDIQFGIIQGAFEIKSRRDSVLRFVLAQLDDCFGGPRFDARGKAAVFGRLYVEVIEYGLCISLDITVGRRRLGKKIDNSTTHIYFDAVLNETSNFC